MIVQVNPQATVEDWALLLGLPLSDDQRGRLAGLRLTLERGRPLRADVVLCDNQGGKASALFVLTAGGWRQVGTDPGWTGGPAAPKAPTKKPKAAKGGR